MEDLQLGDHVIVYNKYKGIIKYIGPLHVPSLAGKTWYGIELDEAIGKHDGTIAGKTYFRAGVNHGTFLQAKDMSLDYRPAKSGPCPKPGPLAGIEDLRGAPLALSSAE